MHVYIYKIYMCVAVLKCRLCVYLYTWAVGAVCICAYVYIHTDEYVHMHICVCVYVERYNAFLRLDAAPDGERPCLGSRQNREF